MSVRSYNRFLTVAAVMTVGLFLASCDEHEQGRILHYKKGVYLGKPDTALSEQQVDELRQRARLQQGG